MRARVPEPIEGAPPACERGLSLVEMVLVIVLLGIISAIAAHFFTGAAASYVNARDASNVAAPGRIALERMVRDIRAIRSQTAADIPLWSSTALDFYDISGARVRYFQSGSELMESTDGGVTSEPLAEGISGLAFAYTDKAGNPVTPAVGQEGSIYDISVQFTVTSGSVAETYRVTVKPRLFQ